MCIRDSLGVGGGCGSEKDVGSAVAGCAAVFDSCNIVGELPFLRVAGLDEAYHPSFDPHALCGACRIGDVCDAVGILFRAVACGSGIVAASDCQAVDPELSGRAGVAGQADHSVGRGECAVSLDLFAEVGCVVGKEMCIRDSSFTVVGMADTAVKEAYQRIVSALAQSGITFPHRRTVINLAPADIRKEGASFDLPMALGILASNELVDGSVLKDYMITGELSLDGSVLPVRGVLPIACLLYTSQRQDMEMVGRIQRH